MMTDDDTTRTPAQPPATPDAKPEVLERVVQGAHETIDRLAEQAAPHVQRWAEGLNSAGDTLHERADSLRTTGDEWAESLRSSVRANPLAAVAAALAIGLLVAKLTR